MKLTKNELYLLVEQEMEQIMGQKQQQVPPGNDPKAEMKGNINKQLRILKFFQETLKNLTLPQELDTITKHAKEAHTSEFLKEILGIDTITVRAGALFEGPKEFMFGLVNELLNQAVEKGKKKLMETGEIAHLVKDPQDRQDALEKHKAKLRKKHKIAPPVPVLNKDVKEE